MNSQHTWIISSFSFALVATVVLLVAIASRDSAIPVTSNNASITQKKSTPTNSIKPNVTNSSNSSNSGNSDSNTNTRKSEQHPQQPTPQPTPPPQVQKPKLSLPSASEVLAAVGLSCQTILMTTSDKGEYDKKIETACVEYMKQFEIAKADEWKLGLFWDAYNAGIRRAQRSASAAARLGGNLSIKEYDAMFYVTFERELAGEILRRRYRNEPGW